MSGCGSQRDENGSQVFPDQAKFKQTLDKAQNYSEGTFTAGLFSIDYPLTETQLVKWLESAKNARERKAAEVLYTHIYGKRGREGDGSDKYDYTLPTSSDEKLERQPTRGSDTHRRGKEGRRAMESTVPESSGSPHVQGTEGEEEQAFD